uniref:Uncharacterized protein n=1 Tax=Sinocyclocheilus anshuiensis TaxID=1608454 RepID=A0A671QA48_9TELE
VSLSTESRHQNLIVFLLTCVNPVYLNEVQAAVVGDESCDLLTVLDQLDPDALSDGRVGLLGFNHNAFGVRSSTEGVGLQSGAQMGLLVLFIMPFLYAAVVPQFSSSTQSTTLACRRKKRERHEIFFFFFQKYFSNTHIFIYDYNIRAAIWYSIVF